MERTEWIDNFLDDNLSDPEKEEFEARLNADPSLRAEVQAQRAVRRAIQKLGDDALRQQFAHFKARMDTEGQETAKEVKLPATRWYQQRGYLAIAASISLLLIAAIFYFNDNISITGNNGVAVTDTARNGSILSGPAGLSFYAPLSGSISEMGYAGAEGGLDSVVVQVYPNESYNFHYRFKDTLQLFMPLTPDIKSIDIEYIPDSQNYILNWSNRKYRLERGFYLVKPLVEQ